MDTKVILEKLHINQVKVVDPYYFYGKPTHELFVIDGDILDIDPTVLSYGADVRIINKEFPEIIRKQFPDGLPLGKVSTYRPSMDMNTGVCRVYAEIRGGDLPPNCGSLSIDHAHDNRYDLISAYRNVLKLHVKVKRLE